MDDQRSQWSFFLHAQNFERNVRFESKSRPRPRNSKNRWEKPETNGTRGPFVSALHSIFQILFPETGCHAKTRLPDRRLWQPARPYLLIINRHTRSILPILPSPIFKKWQNRHSNTFIPRFSHIMLGRKMPTLGKTSRDASDTRAWHTTFTL